MGKQWEDQESDEVKTLSDILKWLRKLQTSIAAGFQGNGGWTDDGTDVRLTTITDKVGVGIADATYKLHVVGDSTSILKISGTVDTGFTSGIETSGDILSAGIYKGTGIYCTTATANSYVVVFNEDGTPAINLTSTNDSGTVTYGSIDIQSNQVSINQNSDEGAIDVRFRVTDPEGIRIQGKDSGATNNALTVYNGNATAFTGTALFSIRNDGSISTTKSINTTAGDSAIINTVAGRFRKDTSGTTFTLTNSLITANSIILLTPANAAIDATATHWTCSKGAGSATITFNAAPTANFDIDFLIIN